MKIKIAIACFVLTGVLYLAACNKEAAVNNNAVNSLSADNAIAAACGQFAYSDTIFFPEELQDDYVVKPISKLTGKFGTFPDGLKINKSNGNIDITESETGLKYLVWFVATGSKDTCKLFITVSGINYTDSIYTLANNPNIMAPVYNANPLQATDCNGGCEFDDGHDDDDGDGFADEPPAGQEVSLQGIAIDKSTGKVNLKQSIKNGALGKDPKDGTFKDFTLNYRISDKSSKTLNKIGFRLFYFKNKKDIPDSLLQIMNAKKKQVLLDDDDKDDDDDDDDDDPYKVAYTTVSSAQLTSGGTSKHGQGEVKCRPPYIIVTGK